MEPNCTDFRILSWNIGHCNGPTGPKTEDEDFLNIITRHKIACFQEVGISMKISGYRNFDNLRKNQSRGGCTTLIHNSLSSFTQRLKFKIDPDCSLNIVGIKIKRKFLKNHDDLYIFNVYIPPANSPTKNTKKNKRTLLQQIVLKVPPITQQVVMVIMGLTKRGAAGSLLLTSTSCSVFCSYIETRGA